MVLNLLRRVWPQTFPAKPTLTSANLPPQSNRVVIITGSTAGIGLELARILYSAGATVYIAARNEQKAQATIQALTAEDPTASGKLNFLPLDLSDLTTIGPFVTQFLERESRLDLLFNNAGVALQPLTQRTAQNLERSSVSTARRPTSSPLCCQMSSPAPPPMHPRIACG